MAGLVALVAVAGVERIAGLEVSTCAYALADRFPTEFSESPIAKRLGRQSIRNRADDLAWVERKIEQLFRLAGIATPAIYIAKE